jgi:hypothetical protein
MSSIKFFKVNSLPAVLEPDSIYFVNTAGILTVHVTDKDGISSLQLSGGGGTGSDLIPFPVRKESPKIVGDNNIYALATQAMVTRRLYVIPFVTPRELTLTNFRISVTGQSAGNAAIGVYNNIKIANGNDNPYQLLTSVTMSTGAPNGNKDSASSFVFQPNTLYWVAIMCSSAPTLRAVNIYSVASSLGRVPSSNTGVSHLYKDYGTFGLPALGPTDLLSGTTNIPAIYLVE